MKTVSESPKNQSNHGSLSVSGKRKSKLQPLPVKRSSILYIYTLYTSMKVHQTAQVFLKEHIWAQKLPQVAVLGLTVCMHLFIFTGLAYLLQYITLEISSLALVDEERVELEDDQNVKE